MKSEFNDLVSHFVPQFILNSWADAIVNADVAGAKELMREYDLHPDTPINDEGERPLVWLLENPIGFFEDQQAKLLLALIEADADVTNPSSPGLYPIERALMSANDKAAAAVAGGILLNNFEGGQQLCSGNPLERIFTIVSDPAERYELFERVKHNHNCIRTALMSGCMDQDEMRRAADYFNMAFWLEPFPEGSADDLPKPGAMTLKLVSEFGKKAAKNVSSMSKEEYVSWEQQAEGEIAVSRWSDLSRFDR